VCEALTSGYAHNGTLSGGKFQPVTTRAIRLACDYSQAAECFKFVAEIAKDGYVMVGWCNLKLMHSHVETAWVQRLKVTCDQLLSNVAFNFDMRRYMMGGERDGFEYYTKEASAAKYMVEFMQTNPSGVLKQDKLNYHAFGSGRYVGAWVQVLGLQSAAGSTLNGKLGRVCGMGTAATTAGGRYQVEVDGRAIQEYCLSWSLGLFISFHIRKPSN
jgi:hypothetical protein